ncbi:MAG: hypothetical protein H6Q02_654 [Acidobacteria bacterium]|nr:hypothetical protein [Acidobacteriota bacterium]
MSEMIRSLKEALDYTRLYRDQTFVIKVGGEVLGSRKVLDEVAVQVARPSCRAGSASSRRWSPAAA